MKWAVEKFLSRLRGREVAPAIVSLRERVEAIRQGEVARALAALHGPSPETRLAIELSTPIVNKTVPALEALDHGRTTRLRWSRLGRPGGAPSALPAARLGQCRGQPGSNALVVRLPTMR